VTAPGPVVAHKTVVYHVGLSFLRAYLALFHRLRVEGREHLPAHGRALVVANHQSFLDIPIVGAAVRRHVAFVARDTLMRSRFLHWFMPRCGVILVRRNAADRAALREMIAHLHAGDVVAVYPEGTRSVDGSVGAFKPGALFAAREAHAPIVPCAIRGAFQAWPRGVRLPRPRTITVRFGAPIEPALEDALELARARILDLLA
jgi:1-acyl-sn-glycerol-3-phosphate acyltransferase